LQGHPYVLQKCFHLLSGNDSFVFLNNILLITKLQRITQDASLLYTLLYHFTITDDLFHKVFPDNIQQSFQTVHILPFLEQPKDNNLRWKAMLGECIQQILRKRESSFITSDQTTILMGIIAL
jgi:hypothetical protein